MAKMRLDPHSPPTRESQKGFNVPGVLHASLRRFAATVQRNAAGVWGVPRSLSSPPKIGARGLIRYSPPGGECHRNDAAGGCSRNSTLACSKASISRMIAERRQLRRPSEKVFDTQTDSAVKFTYTINERRVYLL